MIEEINRQLKSHIDTVSTVGEMLAEPITECVRLIVSSLKKGHKVLIMGNGGSAADAQHMAAELVGRVLMERKALPAIALTTDTSILTAIGNDYGFDEVFKRQVEALARPGDILIGISTSGNSTNVVRALEAELNGRPHSPPLHSRLRHLLCRVTSPSARTNAESASTVRIS